MENFIDNFIGKDGKGIKGIWWRNYSYKVMEEYGLATDEDVKEIVAEDPDFMAEMGRLWFSLMLYHAHYPGEDEPLLTLKPKTKRIFKLLKKDIDDSMDSWERTVTASRENGEKGGRPRKKKPENGEQIPPELPYN